MEDQGRVSCGTDFSVQIRKPPVAVIVKRGVHIKETWLVGFFSDCLFEGEDGLPGALLALLRCPNKDGDRILPAHGKHRLFEKVQPEGRGQDGAFACTGAGQKDALGVRGHPGKEPFQTLPVDASPALKRGNQLNNEPARRG